MKIFSLFVLAVGCAALAGCALGSGGSGGWYPEHSARCAKDGYKRGTTAHTICYKDRRRDYLAQQSKEIKKRNIEIQKSLDIWQQEINKQSKKRWKKSCKASDYKDCD